MSSEDDVECMSVYRILMDLATSDFSEYSKRHKRLRIPILSDHILQYVIQNVTDVTKMEDTMLVIEQPTRIISDINGNLLSFLHFLRRFKNEPNTIFLLIGNIIGDGEFNMEVLSYTLLMKVLFAKRIFLLRSQNEFEDMLLKTDLKSHLECHYNDPQLFTLIVKSFYYFPFCAKLGTSWFVVTGGIGYHYESYVQIPERPLKKLDDLTSDMLFSEPTDRLPIYMPRSDAVGCYFGEKALKEFLDECGCRQLIRVATHGDYGIKYDINERCISLESYHPKELKFFSILIEDTLKTAQEKSYPPLRRRDAYCHDDKTGGRKSLDIRDQANLPTLYNRTSLHLPAIPIKQQQTARPAKLVRKSTVGGTPPRPLIGLTTRRIIEFS